MKIGGPTHHVNRCHPLATPRTLAQVAAIDPTAVVLMANMLGLGPCGKCNFIKKHCKCKG